MTILEASILAGMITVIIVMNIADYMSCRKRVSRWVEARIGQHNCSATHDSSGDELLNLVKDILGQQFQVPPDTLRDDDEIMELCDDLGLELGDLKRTLKKRLGVRLRYRDFFHGDRWWLFRASVDDNSLTVTELAELITSIRRGATLRR